MVELLVALIIVAILLGVAAPSMMELIRDIRQVSQFNQLTGAFREARSEAIKNAQEVTLCARQSLTSCSTNPDDWKQGWLMFAEVDDGSGSNLTYDGNDVMLGIGDVADSIDIVATATIRPAAAAKQAVVQFDSRGRLNWSTGSIVVCDDRGAKHARVLVVGGAGTLRSASGDGVTPPLDAVGTAVTCS